MVNMAALHASATAVAFQGNLVISMHKILPSVHCLARFPNLSRSAHDPAAIAAADH